METILNIFVKVQKIENGMIFINKNLPNNFHYFTIFLIISFYYIGLKFPDIDLKFKGLGHRSILTHSPFMSYGLFYLHKNSYMWLVYLKKYDVTRFVILSFSLGIAIHLLYDLVPKSFKGTSLIKFPYMQKGLTVNQSIIFIFISSMLCSLLTIHYIKTILELILTLALALITFIFKRKVERGFWILLIVFLVCYGLLVYYKIYITKFISIVGGLFV